MGTQVTARIDDDFAQLVDEYMDANRMESRSEAVRELLREGLRKNDRWFEEATDGGFGWFTNWLWNISARLAHITLILVFTYTVGALSGHAVITLPQTLVFGGSALGLALLAVVVVFATVPSYRARMKHQLSEVRS